MGFSGGKYLHLTAARYSSIDGREVETEESVGLSAVVTQTGVPPTLFTGRLHLDFNLPAFVTILARNKYFQS